MVFFALLTLVLFGAGCNTIDTSVTSNSNTDERQTTQLKTGNKVCDEDYFINSLNAFNTTLFDIEPLSTIGENLYQLDAVCQYIGYIGEDNVNNFTTIGIITKEARMYFGDVLTSTQLNERWIDDENNSDLSPSFFSRIIPYPTFGTLPTWSLYTHKDGVTYVVEGIIQNNQHTDQETKDFMRDIMKKLIETKL